jgi:uncharacterized integral membrane protein (TIGR00698 family)
MRRWWAPFPGLFLAIGVAFVARRLGGIAAQEFGHALVDPLVLAILLGAAVRTALGNRPILDPGVDFTAKTLLEVAIVLLGASVDLGALVAAGPRLFLAIALFVGLALLLGFVIARAIGLPVPLAILLAAGNAICGNSAIAAVAPVIGAEREQTAAAIAFTAVLGVVAVLGLPFVMAPLGLTHTQYGVLAGLTVYAVPQVLAAAFPVSAVAGEMATLVKLTRVLLLGPVILGFALARPQRGSTQLRPALGQLLPWFIVGFLLLALVRSNEVLPGTLVYQMQLMAQTLTILAMAGLGLSVDLRALRRIGSRVALSAGLGLLALTGLAVGLIHLLGIA